MNKEEIYDEQIAPLIDKIIAICNQNKIAALISFALPTEDNDSLSCTTAILGGEYEAHDSQIEAYRIIMAGQSEVAQ